MAPSESATKVDLTDAVRVRLHRGGQGEIYRDKSRFRVLVAGRRWGKTTLAVVELVARAMTGKPGRYWYIGPDRTNAKDTVWNTLKDSVDPSWMARQPMETELSIDLRSGATLSVKGAEDPNRLRGRGLRFAVLDEFADMDRTAWSNVIRPQLADHAAPALFIGTPRGYDALYDLWSRGTDPQYTDWASWKFKTIDNPHIDPQEVEQARNDCDERTYRQEWEASFETVSGRAYYAFDRMLHVRPVELDRSVPLCVAVDFNISPSSAVLWQRVGDEARVWREVQTYHAGGESTRATAMRCRQLIAEAHWTGQVRIYGDATGRAGKTTGPSDHAVVRECFPGAAWCIGTANPHVRDRVAAVNTRFRSMRGESRMVVDESCVKLIADFEQVLFLQNGDLDKTSNPLLTHLSDAIGCGIAREWPPARRLIDASYFGS